jgi:hypothetical protein|tara:strand:- start:21079 stop:21246 length:168 start_codon:yes stop_codon:yes gene_type:complete
VPKVNGKSYPYTAAGKKAASAARKAKPKKKKKKAKKKMSAMTKGRTGIAGIGYGQ